jgi:hypothetical protein
MKWVSGIRVAIRMLTFACLLVVFVRTSATGDEHPTEK